MTRNGGRNVEPAAPVDTIYLALSRDVSLSTGFSERDSFLGEAWPALFMNVSAAIANSPLRQA
jgi:hypothetical protein